MAQRRTWRRGLGIALAVLAGLALILAVLAVFLAGPFVEDAIEDARTRLEETLGRPVTVGQVEVWPIGGRVQVRGISVGPTEHEPPDAPALVVDKVVLDLGVWRTLTSFGRRPYIESFDVVGPRANVVKRTDGTLNWGEMSARLQQEPAEPAPAEEGPMSRLRLARGELRDGAIRFLEVGDEERQATVSELTLLVEDAGMDDGGAFSLRAAVLEQQENLKLEAQVEAVDGELLATIHMLTLELEPMPFAPLAPFLAALGAPESTPEQGMLSASVSVAETEQGESRGVGRIAVTAARFPEGRPFDGHLDFDLSADRRTGRISIGHLHAGAGDMTLVARGTLSDLDGAPRVDELEVRSEHLAFERIAAIYPPFDGLTDPLELGGPFTIEASGGGTKAAHQLELAVTLTDATVRLEDKLEKPPGTPAAVHAKIKNDGAIVVLEQGTLDLASWQLAATGRVRREKGELSSYEMQITTPRPDVGGLLRLLPPVASAVSDTRQLGGELSVTANLRGTSDRADVQGSARLANLDVRAPGARFGGGGSVEFAMQREGDEDLMARIHARLSDLEAIYLDVVNKPKGTPLELDAQWKGDEERTRYDFSAQVASLSGNGSATVQHDPSSEPFTADVSLKPFSIRPLLALLPSAGAADVPDVRFDAMKVRAEGVIGRPAALSLAIPSFAARAGRSDLKGSLRFANPESPRIAFDGRSTYLDLDDFLPRRTEPREGPSPLARADGRLALRVERGRAARVPYRNLDARLQLHGGRATAEVLEVDALGGHLSGTGSQVPVFIDEGPYRIQGTAKAVQVDSLLTRFAGADQLMTGSLGATFDLRAADTTPEALARTLTGRLEGRLGKARFLPGSAVGAFVDRLQAVPAVGMLARDQVEQLGTWQLDDLSGALVFDEGAVVLQEPLTAQTPQGPLTVRGKLRLGGPIDLSGTIRLQPASLDSLFGTDLPIDQPLPLEFRMTGTLARPKFAFGDLEDVAKPILQAYLKKSVGTDVEANIQEAVRGLLGGEPEPEEDKSDKAPPDGDGKRTPPPDDGKQKKDRRPNLEQEVRRQFERLF